MKIKSIKERLLLAMGSTREPHHLRTDRRKKLIKGIAIVIGILAVPFFFYAYRLVPHVEETEFLGITFKAGQHAFLDYYAYYLFTKVVFLLCFIVWFHTCKYWWREALIVPICMLLFQILGIVNTSVSYIDEFDFWYSVPVVIPMAAVIWFASKKLNGYRRSLDLLDEIQNEVERVKNKHVD